MSKIVLTNLNTVVYARAFFITQPHTVDFEAGQTRFFDMRYARGTYAPTAFEMLWYANVLDADAQRDELTDTARLPTAVFTPATPDTDAEIGVLQEGGVRLTAPASNGYANPVGIIRVTEDTGDNIKPHIYLVRDTITVPTRTAYTDYDFRYTLGNPKIVAFHVEWYANVLDANFMRDKLTDTDRLPRVEFIPSTPNQNADVETLQEGIVRVYRPVSDNPYTSAVGLLCVEQDKITGRECEEELAQPESNPYEPVMPVWER